jgi:glycine cleavage system H protein
MATLHNCNLPDELYYLVEKHVWLRPSGDGPVTVGIGDVAQSLAGPIVSCTPKKAGRAVPKGQSVATIESSKWVGPMPAPVAGEIVEVNEMVRRDPGLLNRDPYGEGWLVRLKPSSWDADRAGLAPGPEGLEAYRAFLESQGIQCRPAGG